MASRCSRELKKLRKESDGDLSIGVYLATSVPDVGMDNLVSTESNSKGERIAVSTPFSNHYKSTHPREHHHTLNWRKNKKSGRNKHKPAG